MALAAIESACLTWGGIFSFLIPCPPNGQPTPEWKRALDAHDPDVLIDLAGADPEFIAIQKDRWDRVVYRWDDPTTTMEIADAAVFSALGRWKVDRQADRSYYTVNLHPLAGHPLALPLAFRFGHLDRRPMSREMIISIAYRADRHERYVDLQAIDPHRIDQQIIDRLLASVPLDATALVAPPEGGLARYPTLPGLTSATLPTTEASYSFGPAINFEIPQFDEAYLRRIVIVSEPNSVADLCLAWNIRAQRSSSETYPIWLTPELLAADSVLAIINRGRPFVREGLSERQGSRDLHFVSATIALEDLRRLIPEALSDTVVHDSTTLDRFFTPGFHVGLQDEEVVNFRRGVAEIRSPDVSQLGIWEAPQRIGWTVAVEGHAFPRGSDHDFGYPPAGELVVRQAKDGISGMLNVPFTQPESLRTIGVHDRWSAIMGLANRAGYDVNVSEKGHLAIAIMSLFDAGNGLGLIASSLVYNLLRSMSEINARQALQRAAKRYVDLGLASDADEIERAALEDVRTGGQFDRQHLTQSRICDHLGPGVSPDDCKRLITWLVAQRILFQGYEFRCPTCRARRWFAIGRLSNVQTCDGCQSATADPITVDQLQWFYRLNESVGHAIDQGVLPHLLAVHRANQIWDDSQHAPLLGFLPGVDFIPQAGTNLPKIEVDLIAIKGGRAIVGECKASAGALSDSEVDRFADLAFRLSCSRVVYAVAEDSDRDEAVLQRARQSNNACIEHWPAELLFDWLTPFGPRQDPTPYLGRLLNFIYDPWHD